VLEELQLRDLGVICDATFELGPGFTAITGETGAGKTMVLSGLALIFGGRADSGLVRAGCQRATVDARLRVPASAASVRSRLSELGAELESDTLIVSRSVAADGRARAHVGGRPVPVATLAELADELVTVHGQADQRGLLRPTVQRHALDRFAGDTGTSALAAYRGVFEQLAAVRDELREVTERRRERMQEADVLRLGLAEIAAVSPQPHEDGTLRNEIDRLAHVDQLVRAATSAHAALGGGADAADMDVLTLVASARTALDESRGRDAELDAMAARLGELAYLLSDLSADLAGYHESLEADPLRLEHAQQRLAQLSVLTRKYAEDVDAVIEWAAQASRRLTELDGDDDRVDELSRSHEMLVGKLATAARALTAIRRQAGGRLEVAVTDELASLAMPTAKVSVVVGDHADDHGLDIGGRKVAFGPLGVDDVQLLLMPHPGAPARPLHKSASGGELSRIMLALEVVLAGSDPVPTFVFDEVDAGVGGQAAVEVGRRLAALARNVQVIVVTHLPQVAAFADRHLVVRKSDDGTITTTGVHPVEGEQRLEELSRMLAGMSDSELGRGHAQELLTAANAAKQPG
jgi:DNA repair protein RecN (Recombination protein N)